MARQARVQYPGAVFHVTSRGNEQRDIFLTDADRLHFLELLARAIDRFRWILSAYVLMTNHFHLMIELTAETLSSGMQWLNGAYANWFNLVHTRAGHLFQGPFVARVIEKETYHFNVLRYVVLNPVRAGMVRTPEDYVWSSYAATAGVAQTPEWLDADGVLRIFGDDRAVAEARYRDFIHSWDGQCPWDHLVGGMYLGSEEWLDKVRNHVAGSRPLDAEHPFRQRRVKEVEFIDVLAAVADEFGIDPTRIRTDRGGDARLMTAWLGSRHCLLPLTTIAAGLRIRSSGRVSTLAKRCDERLQVDAQLRDLLDRCRERLYIS